MYPIYNSSNFALQRKVHTSPHLPSKSGHASGCLHMSDYQSQSTTKVEERFCGALGAQSSEQAPFTSEIMGFILAMPMNSCENSQSTLCRKLWVFPGCSGFLPQGQLIGWVRINRVEKVISQLL